jgi:hypothetical protein
LESFSFPVFALIRPPPPPVFALARGCSTMNNIHIISHNT